MSNLTLAVKKRVKGPQSLLTKLIKNSRVPAVVYGFATDPINVDVDYNEAVKIIKAAGTSHMVDLQVDSQKLLVIVRDYQQHPVSDKLTHIDFLAVSDKKTLTTMVPVELVGVSKAVKELGCKLNVKNQTLRVRCLPQDLPAKFIIDLATLSEVGQAIVVGDIPTGPGVTILNNPKDPVVSVTIPRQIEETPAPGAVAATPGAEGAATAETPVAEGEPKTEAAAGEAKK